MVAIFSQDDIGSESCSKKDDMIVHKSATK